MKFYPQQILTTYLFHVVLHISHDFSNRSCKSICTACLNLLKHTNYQLKQMLLAVSRELLAEKNLTNIAEIKCNFEMIFRFLKVVTEKLTKNGTVVLQQICICSHHVI